MTVMDALARGIDPLATTGVKTTIHFMVEAHSDRTITFYFIF
jgi:hypothetical protein